MVHIASLIKSHQVVSLTPSSTVLEAAKIMAEHNIGSVVLMTGDNLEGIFTERDLLKRVVAKGLDLNNTLLSEVASKVVTTISSHESVESCFSKMQEVKSRRVPVVDDGKVVGIVTMRDILEWLIDEMKEENIHLKNYIQSY